VEGVKEKHPEIHKDMDTAAADKGYDREENCRRLYDEHGIKPVIDIRRMWRNKETKLLDPGRSDNIVYDEEGAHLLHLSSDGGTASDGLWGI
jgi:hypothetical protein